MTDSKDQEKVAEFYKLLADAIITMPAWTMIGVEVEESENGLVFRKNGMALALSYNQVLIQGTHRIKSILEALV
jgi:hypothetical protein